MTREEAAKWLEGEADYQVAEGERPNDMIEVVFANLREAAAMLRQQADDTLTLSMAYDQGRADERAKWEALL